MLDVKFLAW